MHRILIRRDAGNYYALADDLHKPGRVWSSTLGSSREQVIHELFGIGWHQQDIGDALYDADNDWQAHEDS